VKITAKHHEVEARFRELVASADMPPPDDVEYEPECLVFFWHAPKLAVVVDFDDAIDVEAAAPPCSRERAGSQKSSQAVPSPLVSRSNGSSPTTRTGPVYSGPSPSPPSQS
jgi:hypothetical protein